MSFPVLPGTWSNLRSSRVFQSHTQNMMLVQIHSKTSFLHTPRMTFAMTYPDTCLACMIDILQSHSLIDFFQQDSRRTSSCPRHRRRDIFRRHMICKPQIRFVRTCPARILRTLSHLSQGQLFCQDHIHHRMSPLAY